MRSSNGGEFTEEQDIWKLCECGRASYIYATRCPLCVSEMHGKIGSGTPLGMTLPNVGDRVMARESEGIVTQVRDQDEYCVQVRLDGREWFYPQWSWFKLSEVKPI